MTDNSLKYLSGNFGFQRESFLWRKSFAYSSIHSIVNGIDV
jgi:hypothetical protein